MREIKFRAWCTKYGDPGFMVFPSDFNDEFITFDGKPVEVVASHKTLDLESLPLEYQLMQYTGIRDSNKKEVYEGDIISVGKNHIGYVYFDAGCYYITDFGRLNSLGSPEIGGEVIGNIYENKDLLEGETK